YGTDTRAAELLVGALLAIALNYRRVTHRIATDLRVQRTLRIAGLVALLICTIIWIGTDQQSGWLYRGGFAVYALLSAAVLTAALLPAGPVRTLLGSPPLRILGLLSYGVYLYHWPVFLWIDRHLTGLDGLALFTVRFGITMGLAIISYRFIELPVRRGEPLFGSRPIRLVPWVAGSVAAAVIAITITAPKPLIDFAAAQAELQHATATLAQPRGSTEPLTSGPPRPRIAVFGDSTAMLTSVGLRNYLLASGRADYAGGWTQLGCGISRYGDRRDAKDEGPVSDECNRWDDFWTEQLRAGQPNLALVQVGPWEVVDRRLPGDKTWRSLGDPRYDDYLLNEMLHAVDVLSANGAQVMWLTLPHLGAPPGEDPLKLRGPGADPRRADRFNELLRQLPALRPNRVRVIELAAWLESTGEDARLRPDGVHFSDRTAYEVSERWLVDQLITGFSEDWTARQREELARRAEEDLPDARVLWVGDSSALGFALGMHNYAKLEGGFAVGNISRIGCGIGRGGWRKDRDRQEPIPADCEPFTTLYPREVAATKPDLVFVMTGFWDVTDRKLPGDDHWRAPGDPVYDEYLQREFAEASDLLHEQGATVVWFTYPHIDLGKDETPPRSYPVNDPARIDRQNQIIRELAESRSWIKVIDLASYAQTLPGGEFDPWYRPDGVHFSATGAEQVFRDWLKGEVMSIYRARLAGDRG
ncbi:MAG: acyltransferase family protein, partial [Acidimicrobiales bacterium]|nr:acyltransferase family protein [Acidimicrobiales bacterium]